MHYIYKSTLLIIRLFLIDLNECYFICNQTRPGVDKVKPKAWFKYSLYFTNRNSAGLFHHVLICMGDLYLVLPALNLSTLDDGILIMVQQERMMMFSLNMVDYSVSFLSLST